MIPYVQRQHLEDELYRLDKKDALFTICTLNFIRWSLEDRIVSFAFFDALVACTKDELIQFFKVSLLFFSRLDSLLCLQGNMEITFILNSLGKTNPPCDSDEERKQEHCLVDCPCLTLLTGRLVKVVEE